MRTFFQFMSYKEWRSGEKLQSVLSVMQNKQCLGKIIMNKDPPSEEFINMQRTIKGSHVPGRLFKMLDDLPG